MGTKILVAVGAAACLGCCCSSASLLALSTKKSTPPQTSREVDSGGTQPRTTDAPAQTAADATRVTWSADAKTVPKKTTKSPESTKTPAKKATAGAKKTTAPTPPAPAQPAVAAGGASLGTFGATFYSFQSNGGNATGAYTSPLTAGRSIAISNKAKVLAPKQTYVMKRGGATSCVSIDDKCSGSGCHDIDIYTGSDHAAALAGGITTVEIIDQRC